MSTNTRPISPHLSAYKFRITSTLSILHRMTGVLLSFGAIVLVAWLIAVASGPSAYEQFAGLAGSLPGRLVLAGFVYAFFYHLGNGIRHLFWDAGHGFEIEQARASGWAVVCISTLLAVGVWLVALV